MTSEPDSTLRRRPPTIDLTASEVEEEKPASAKPLDTGESATRRAGRNFTDHLSRHAIGAVAGAIVMAAILAGLWLADYVPPREPGVPASAPAANSTALDGISSRLDSIQAALTTQQQSGAALASRMTAAEATTKSLGEALAALTTRLDSVATTAQGALGQAKEVSAAAGQAKTAAQAAVQHSDLDALAGRVAELETAVKTLSRDAASKPPGANDSAVRLTIVAEALRSAVERGAPYQAELAALKALGLGRDATAPLDQFAASGVPSAAALAHELSLLTPALLSASGDSPSDNTYLGRLEASAQKLVRITPINAPSGNAPAAVVARINADASRTDLAAARADIAQLPDAAKILAGPWTKKAEARDAAIAASASIAAKALADLDKQPIPQ
jgi:hypothetical protein